MSTQMIKLLAIDDFVLADWSIPPAVMTTGSSQLGFGVERRAGIASSVFFGATAQPANWKFLFQCGGNEAARQALISMLASQGNRQFRLLAQRLLHGEELITTEAAVSGELDERARGDIYVPFEGNDSVWLAEDTFTTSKTFTSPLDQTMHLAVPGNIPTHPVIRITPTAQRVETTPYVGWSKRRRYVISNEGTDPLFREAVMIDLGNTAALVSGGKARSDGADLRVWLHGLEQARSLVDWNTSSTALWVIVPVLPPRQSLTYDIVYGNPLATDADGVELTYPDAPAFDITASTNFVRVYRTGTDITNAGEGLWPLSSPLEGGSADYGVPGAWQPALTFENPNNTDNYVQPRSRRVGVGQNEWYQAVPFAARWRGDDWDGEFEAYAGSDPFDGVTLYNPFGIRSVQTESFTFRNNAREKTVVPPTAGDPGDETPEPTEVLVPRDPPFTRVVAIGRNTGGEGWHVLAQYAQSTGGDLANPNPGRLYLPSTGAVAAFPAFASGWEVTTNAQRLPANTTRGRTTIKQSDITLGTTAADIDVLISQYVYPLPEFTVFTTSDTVKGRLKAYETVAGMDARAQMVIRVMSATSEVKATLLDFDTASLSNEFSSTLPVQTRAFPRGGALNLLTGYISELGDYLVIEYGFRKHGTAGGKVILSFQESELQYDLPNPLPEDESTDTGHPWIEFRVDLTGGAPPLETAWTPPGPVKHFGLACWPSGVTSIPDDAEGRASLEVNSDITVHIAAEPLFITQVEAETDIYELGTELRVLGGGNAIGPYHALLVGNARQMAGPGTPRASLILDAQALQVDTERRTHTIWDTEFTVQQEAVSTHAVRALAGNLRQVDATDVPSLMRTAATIPNADFASTITGWESHSGGGGWSVSVAHDAAVGGVAAGSLKFAITSSSAGTLWYRSSTYIPVTPGDSVEMTAWVRQNDSGASSPRIGIAWYDANPTLLATSTDQFYGVNLNPANDHILSLSAAVPANVTQCRVLLGVTVEENVPATKWFDDVALAVIRPLRYDATIAKVTEEMRASRWLPLTPPRRTVINGAFDADISGWELHDDGSGITHTASYDPDIGGYQDGSLKVTISANSGSDQVVYLNAQPLGINGQESEAVAAWVRTDDEDIVPRLCIAWYTDPEESPVSIATEAPWEPAVNTGYNRAFGAIAPPEVAWFRVGIVVDTAASATGAVWLDDVTLNDNDLFIADVEGATLDVDVTVRPRFIP